jgi:hypothetical protein
MPVTQAQLFRWKLFSLSPRDRDLWRIGGADNAKGGRPHFNVTRRQLGIAHVFRTKTYFSIDGDNGLLTKRAGSSYHVRGRPFWIEGYLNDSRSIAKINEHDPAEVPRAMNPAGNSYPAARMLWSESSGEICPELSRVT